MENSQLLQYIKGKFQEKPGPQPGPVVTVSREYGCQGNQFGEMLAKTLSGRECVTGGRQEWKALGREILNDASTKINLPPDIIDEIVHHKPRSIFAEFFKSFSDQYTPGDIEVKKAIADLVTAVAHAGHAVIIGQGGAVLSGGIKDAFHIRLIAPAAWRVKQVMEMHSCSESEAERIIEHVDRERIYLRRFFSGELADPHDYDVIFNTERMSLEEIQASVLLMLEKRGILLP